MAETPAEYTVTKLCQCGGQLGLRQSKVGGMFLGCSNYPQCKQTQAYDQVLAEMAQSMAKLADLLEKRGGPRRAGRKVPGNWRVIPGGKSQ